MKLLKQILLLGALFPVTLPVQGSPLFIYGCPNGSSLDFAQDENDDTKWKATGTEVVGIEEMIVRFEGYFQGKNPPKPVEKPDVTNVGPKGNGVFELTCKYRLENTPDQVTLDMKTIVNGFKECKKRIGFFMCS